ncbi:glucan biosynthesis protein [Pseudooceanicola sp. C21-150M6]|uniref:glucan biosynthesis protein n=1 Tax=Pseudooceanicola sp. C21-150M6 TaxID=3434355 RepID=UPI003D7FD5C4
MSALSLRSGVCAGGVSRRALLSGLAAGAVCLPLRGVAQDQAASGSSDFSFDWLSERMREASGHEMDKPLMIDGALAELDYDAYGHIRFDRSRNRWQSSEGSLFGMNAFHPGWLFKEPVLVHEVIDGKSRPMIFTTEDFEYDGLDPDLISRLTFEGVAGVRIMNPLNRADVFDELVAFLGASYFRGLGKGTVYGLSARGLAVNTGMSEGEEFPRFSEFWLERPAEGQDQITIYAALDSKSVTGAYRFVITPGEDTVMDVTARLFLRRDIAQLGVAPLTSMYLFGGSDPGNFDDFRPAVHDSEALVMTLQSGETFYRPLNNPQKLASAFLGAENPTSFGLVQRTRSFEEYLDGEARYHLRPSLMVEPVGDWGRGAVRLLEIPSDQETNDNIGAFWVPHEPTRAGDALEYHYRLHWGLTPEGDGSSQRARVLRTRVGKGGVSGVSDPVNRRKFVVDFSGGLLRELPADAEVTPSVSISRGDIVETVLSKIPGTDTWRLVIEARADSGSVAELKASVSGFDRVLTETWLYQWMKS